MTLASFRLGGGLGGANQSPKSIYKCTDTGRLARGHSVEVLFVVCVVSTSISHLSTCRRQRRNDMLSVTFSYRRAQTSVWVWFGWSGSVLPLRRLFTLFLPEHIGCSHLKDSWHQQDSLFPGTLSSFASVARCTSQPVLDLCDVTEGTDVSFRAVTPTRLWPTFWNHHVVFLPNMETWQHRTIISRGPKSSVFMEGWTQQETYVFKRSPGILAYLCLCDKWGVHVPNIRELFAQSSDWK